MPDATTLIHIDQYNTNKQNFENKKCKNLMNLRTKYWILVV